MSSNKRKPHHQHHNAYHHHHHQIMQPHQQQLVNELSQPIAGNPTTTTTPLMNAKRLFPECAIEALKFIGANMSRTSKPELVRLAQECIFLNEFDTERNAWMRESDSGGIGGGASTSVTENARSAMQELQAVDCILAYLKSTEIEPNVRDQLFSDVLFSELSATAPSLQLLTSYAVSLECTPVLECICAWVVHNIGNEIAASIFDQLVYDHFLLGCPLQSAVSSPMASLSQKSPMFASLFMAIVLDMLSNHSIKCQDKCLGKLIDVFEIWVRLNN